ncbi:hypothetical protein Tco_0136609, partial [Tanacetum coccineum]
SEFIVAAGVLKFKFFCCCFNPQAYTYVVPTGRVIATESVIVATSGYVVPVAYDISPGRVK